jgi:two-component system, LytTR family, sensor kinase
MKPRVARALLVLTVFALLGVLAATARYVADVGRPPEPAPPAAPAQQHGNGAPPSSAPVGPHEDAKGESAAPKVTLPRSVPPSRWKIVFLGEFRLYLAWALVAPGVLYLARRVPLLGRRRGRALAFHAIVPLAGTLPFFFFRLVVNVAFGLQFPSWTVLVTRVPWAVVFALQAAAVVPVYWLLVGVGTAVQFLREHEARELNEVELRRSLAAAQLDALKFKLQPHFLFNTLNAIASLAQAGDTDGAGRVVERLGALLRISMETSGRQLVTLDEELAAVDAYLAIEEIRFGDRLRIVRRVAPDTRHALVPNLILQPLVENALVHGLSRRLDASLLEVAARREGRVLHIAVRDDGPGLPAAWKLETHAGAGLRNVSDRIQGLYPSECGFRMENGATGGAVALLSIPFADAETTAIAAECQPWMA